MNIDFAKNESGKMYSCKEQFFWELSSQISSAKLHQDMARPEVTLKQLLTSNIFRNLFTGRKRKMSGKNKDHLFANLICKVGAAFLGKSSWECRWVVFQIWLQNKAFVELKFYRILGKY